MSGNSGGTSGPVKGILKKGKGSKTVPKVKERPPKGPEIQWDEMNILMTEHPANKDYGHMKIEEPKTPYHEMLPSENQGASTSAPPDTLFSPETLAQKVQEASTKQSRSRRDWEKGGDAYSSDEEMSEETKDHKKKFSDWRKKHYNEFYVVQRAKELMAQDEEELMELGSVDKQASSSLDDDPSLMDDESVYEDT